MSSTTANRPRRIRRSAPRQIGPITALIRAFPYIVFGALMGFAIYNPSGYSLWHLADAVFLGGLGTVTDATGAPLAFYYQPANIFLLIVLILIAGFVWFKWEIAKDEKIFLLAFALIWVLANLGVIGAWTAITGVNPFSPEWVKWQVLPGLMAALAFGAVLPKIRRAYSGAITAGGGSFDIEDMPSDHDH